MNKFLSLIFCLVAAFISFVTLAKDLPSDAPLDPRLKNSTRSGYDYDYYGKSGKNPYDWSTLESDEVFIADKGGDLDQYLFKTSNPYHFNLDITRFFGETNGSGVLINPKAIGVEDDIKLTITVYDVDGLNLDALFINGHKLNKPLENDHETWSTVVYSIPVEWIKFPNKIGEVAANKLVVKRDIKNPAIESIHVLEVDWALLEIKALRPLLLLQSSNGNRPPQNLIKTLFVI